MKKTLPLLAAGWLLAGGLHADERAFGYVYQAEVLPQGGLEFEQWVTSRVGRAEGIYAAWDLKQELEWGLTERLTTALYLKSKSEYSSVHDAALGKDVDSEEFHFEGVSSEWKYLLLNPQEHWLGLLGYAEAGYNGPELELEAKLILEHRFSEDLTLALNAIVEQESTFTASAQSNDGGLEFTGGLSYRLRPTLALGLEFRNHRNYPDAWAFEKQSAWFLGPSLHWAGAKAWGTLSVLPQIGGRPESLPGDGRQLDTHEKLETRLVVGVDF